MSSPIRRAAGEPRVNEVVSEAEELVRLWDSAEDGVTPRIPTAQLKVLSLLRRSGPMKLSVLAREFGVIPSSASRLCDRLEATGLVRREIPRDNRREVWLSVTLEGSRRLEGFDAARREDFGLVFDSMGASDQAALLEGLRGFTAAAETAREDSVRQA